MVDELVVEVLVFAVVVVVNVVGVDVVLVFVVVVVINVVEVDVIRHEHADDTRETGYCETYVGSG